MVDSRPTILVIGEALMDVVRHHAGTPVEHVGGSPANVAVGLSRLDQEVRLATSLGDDARGHRIATHLRRHGVVVDRGGDNDASTSVAIANLDESGTATYTFDLHWEPGTVAIDERVGHIHTGSIAAVLLPGAQDVIDAIERGRGQATISYDPNVRPSIMGDLGVVRDQIEATIARSDIVKASADDLELLYPDIPIEDVLARWGGLGAALTVATRAGDGVTFRVTRTGETVTLPAPPTHVVDTVGAGDSFMAGLISGLAAAGFLGGPTARDALYTADAAAIQPAVERGARCGAITVSRAGAYAPSLDEL